MAATAHIFEALPLRNAALKQVLKSIDPKSVVEEKVNDSDVRKENKKKPIARKSEKPVAKKSEKPVAKKSEVTYRDTPPSSPEPGGKRKKNAEKKAVDNLFSLINKALKPKKNKKRVSRIGDESEAEAEADPTWFDGIVTPEDLSIEKLKFKPGTYFLGRYKILHVVNVDETKGGTYIAYINHCEVVLRVNFIQRDDMELLTTEGKFLETMERNSAQGWFSTMYDMGIVNKCNADGLVFYAVHYRGGPTLMHCHTLCKTFRSETIDRLAAQFVHILEQICGQGYRIISLSLDDFTMDYRSRLVFLHNYTNIVKVDGIKKDVDQEEEDEEEEEGEGLVKMSGKEKKGMLAWKGHADFAPINWHLDEEGHVMSEMDTIESLIYFLIYMHKGELPWTTEEDKMTHKLLHCDNDYDDALLHSLPPSLKCLWKLMRASTASGVSFPFIHGMVTKHVDYLKDYNFDWEFDTFPSKDEERLICQRDIYQDRKKVMRILPCVFENASRFSKR